MKRSPITKVLVVFMSLLLVCTSVLAVPSSVEAAAKPSKITLSAKKQTLYVGQKYSLKVKSVKPANASKAVKFATSNKKVAVVSAKGQITAKKVGSATITVTSKVNSKAKATCKITVKPAVKTIEVKNAVSNTVAVRLKKTLKLQTSVSPSNVANKKLEFKSGNKKIVTVDKNGKIKAKKAGKTTITIKALGANKVTKKITVIVPDKKKQVTGVKLSATAQTLTVGGNFTLKPTITPAKVATKLVSYKSSNTKVATVDAKGKVVAVAPGTATITVTTLDGAKKATCKVTVNPVYVSGITLSAKAATLEVGKNVTLTATVTPANAANKTLKWTSSNPAVATVVNGVVTAVAPGTATITVASTDGSNVTATATITVNKAPAPVDPKPEEPKPEEPKEVKVTAITLDKTSEELEIGGTVTITATVTPDNATNKNIDWTTSDDKVATVENGVVTAVAAGTATITATAADGSGVTATATITVKEATVPEPEVKPVTSITLSATEKELVAGDTVTLTVSVLPTDADNKKINWTSDKESVATVDANGVVTAVAAGTATITATAADGSGVKATCVITVVAREIAIEGITLPEKMTIYANTTDAKLEPVITPADTTMDKKVTYTTSIPVLTVGPDGTLNPMIFAYPGSDVVVVEVTATTANGKTATCEVTVIVRTDARTETDYTYNFTLDKKAESYYVEKGDRNVSVSTESIAKDIQTVAGIEWNNNTIKKYWNTDEIKKLVTDLALAKEFGIVDRLDALKRIEVTENTMKVTAKGRTVVVTRSENADGSSNLTIKSGGTTAEVRNINVTSGKNTAGVESYIISATAVAKGKEMSAKAVIAKDASKAEVYRVYADGSTGKVVTVESTETAYKVEVNRSLYKEALDLVGVKDPLPTITIMNNYTPVE